MRTLTAALALALACAAAPAQDNAVDLRPNFVEGQTARYEFWTLRTEVNTTRFAGNERSVTIEYEYDGQTTWRVGRVRNDGSADCEMTIDWFTISITTNDQTLTADSRKGPGEWTDGHAFAKALAGKTLTVRVAPDGEIKSVDGVNAIRNAIDGDDQAKPDEKDFIEEAAYLAVLWGAPAQASIGDTWRAAFDWNHEMGTLHYKTTYTLYDVGQLAGIPVATVGGESSITMDFDDPDLPPDAPPVTMRLDSAREHEQIVFDLSRHEAVARNLTLNLKATQSLRLPQGELSNVREETVQGQVVRLAEE